MMPPCMRCPCLGTREKRHTRAPWMGTSKKYEWHPGHCRSTLVPMTGASMGVAEGHSPGRGREGVVGGPQGEGGGLDGLPVEVQEGREERLDVPLVALAADRRAPVGGGDEWGRHFRRQHYIVGCLPRALEPDLVAPPPLPSFFGSAHTSLPPPQGRTTSHSNDDW